MSAQPFAHLHCHSHYSLLDGASRIPELVRHVKSQSMEALALTDHGNLHGAVEFLREAKAAGVKPIVGLEAYVAPGKRTDRSKAASGRGEEKFAYHLTLLARTGAGVRNLIRLSSKSWLEGFYFKPRIDKEILAQHSEGLICLSGCASSELSALLLQGRTEEADRLCVWYEQTFGRDNFFIEIQNNGIEIQQTCLDLSVDLANRMGLPLVATSDAHYLTRDDAPAHDILLCINTGRTIDDAGRMRFDNDQFFVRSPAEMYDAIPAHGEALARSALIAESVEEHYPSLELGKRQFPSFEPPGGKSAEDYLRELCEQGMVERYGPTPRPEVRERLDHELATINRMGFASYFLIVWDFVRHARERGIAASARGSACGAVVSYLLHLSHVCPLKYDLLFERFLDPNRSEAPDIDIDLCQERRYEVIQYVREKYGAANVAQIGTFGTLKAKAAIKDVGRALNIPLARVEQINKLVPNRLNITIAEAINEEPQLKKLMVEDAEISRLLEFAKRLEGTNRSVGTHAAGVVIADRPLEDLVPLQRISNKDKAKEVVSTQWEMGDLEKAGLLKMDFLGLRNLTTLGATMRLINRARPDDPLDLDTLPLDDDETYQLLQRGESKGVFQLESAGIRDLLIKMKPDRFADIIATIALYRPGPLNGGMVDQYVDVKHGRQQATYLHPVLREVLEETYGVMVYQEQVMRILNRLGGIELSRAYATIKAISKKNKDTIAKSRDAFIAGAVERGLERDKAAKIFELIEFFGGYGFNKSHSTAYALVAYQTAYLKAHYPTEFMAALLSSEMDGAEREKFFYEHLEDCRRMAIEVRPPSVNQGGLSFEVAGPGQVTFGLGAIKGVGTKAIEALLKSREDGGAFLSLDEFAERVSPREVTQAAAETLIRAGAFDCMGARRSQLLAVLPRVLLAGQAKQVDQRRGQRGLFDDLDDEPAIGAAAGAAAMNLPDLPELPDAELLAGEKKALGFYMSSHPLARHVSELQAFRSHAVDELEGLPDRAEVTLGGMIGGMKLQSVKSRTAFTRMAKFSFVDLSGSINAMMWPDQYAKYETLLKEDLICFVKGTIDRRREPAELVISKVIPLEQAARELAKALVITFRKGKHTVETLERAHRIVRQYAGGPIDLYIEVVGLPGVRRAVYRAGWSFRISIEDKLIADLQQALGATFVRLLGQSGSTGRPAAETLPRPTQRVREEPADAVPEEEEIDV